MTFARDAGMTEMLFYHLQRQPIEKVLPALLEKSLARGWRVVVLWECGLKDEARLERELRQALALPLEGGGLGGGVPRSFQD